MYSIPSHSLFIHLCFIHFVLVLCSPSTFLTSLFLILRDLSSPYSFSLHFSLFLSLFLPSFSLPIPLPYLLLSFSFPPFLPSHTPHPLPFFLSSPFSSFSSFSLPHSSSPSLSPIPLLLLSLLPHTDTFLPLRLPKNQDCHELWCKQRRKKKDPTATNKELTEQASRGVPSTSAGKVTNNKNTSPSRSGYRHMTEGHHQVMEGNRQVTEGHRHVTEAAHPRSSLNGPMEVSRHAAVSRLHMSYPQSNFSYQDSIRSQVYSSLASTSSSSSSSSTLHPSHPHTAPHPPGHVDVATATHESRVNQQYSSSSILNTKQPHPHRFKPPLISVPLPSRPLTSSILDSLEDGSESVASGNTGSNTGGLQNARGDPNHAVNSSSVPSLYPDRRDSGVAARPQAQPHSLQKVTETQRTQVSVRPCSGLHQPSSYSQTATRVGVTLEGGGWQGSRLPSVPPRRGSGYMSPLQLTETQRTQVSSCQSSCLHQPSSFSQTSTRMSLAPEIGGWQGSRLPSSSPRRGSGYISLTQSSETQRTQVSMCQSSHQPSRFSQTSTRMSLSPEYGGLQGSRLPSMPPRRGSGYISSSQSSETQRTQVSMCQSSHQPSSFSQTSTRMSLSPEYGGEWQASRLPSMPPRRGSGYISSPQSSETQRTQVSMCQSSHQPSSYSQTSTRVSLSPKYSGWWQGSRLPLALPRRGRGYISPQQSDIERRAAALALVEYSSKYNNFSTTTVQEEAAYDRDQWGEECFLHGNDDAYESQWP